MDIAGLYNFVLLIVLVGILGGVGVLLLDKFTTSSGVTSTAQTSINGTRDAVGEIGSTWMSLIVTIGVLAVILVLVLRSFGVGRGR